MPFAALSILPFLPEHWLERQFVIMTSRRNIMQIAEAMTRDVQTITPDQSIVDAARMMADCDCGALPVEENDRLVGMITDRDIVVRALAEGKAADARVKDIMSADIKYCYEEDDL